MLLSAERGTGSLQDSSPPLHTLGKELIHLHVGASSTTAVMSKTQRGASPASSLHGTRSRRQLGEAGTGVAQPGGGGREGGMSEISAASLCSDQDLVTGSLLQLDSMAGRRRYED